MKIICVGRNYADHAKELNNPIPQKPLIFLKPDSAILRKGFPFVLPTFSEEVHYECELVVRINKVGKHIQEEFAGRYYDQIGLGLDFTARDLQSDLKSKGHPWEISKGFDGSCFVSNFYDKTRYDLSNINFKLFRNNALCQHGQTKDLIFSIDYLIAYVSQYFTLKKGDLIFTGTPSGVGALQAGDFLAGELEGDKVFEVRVR